MRIKAIMVGAIAALALVTLTANAGTTAAPRISGSLVSLVTATTTVTQNGGSTRSDRGDAQRQHREDGRAG